MTRLEILQIAKPILFNTDMVRATLDGRKTVTRRAIKPQLPYTCPECRYTQNEFIYDLIAENVYCARCGEPLYNGGFPYKAPYQPRDILYVRETWGTYNRNWWEADYFMYRADYPEKASTYMHSDGIICDLPKWRPSIHMPKEAARIFLRVTDVRVEQLQDITEEQAEKEGAIDNRGFIHSPGNEYDNIHTAKEHYKQIWNSTIPKKDLDKYGWDANPWVWVIEFERVEVEP